MSILVNLRRLLVSSVVIAATSRQLYRLLPDDERNTDTLRAGAVRAVARFWDSYDSWSDVVFRSASRTNNHAKSKISLWGLSDSPLHDDLVSDTLSEIEWMLSNSQHPQTRTSDTDTETNGTHPTKRPTYFEGWYYKIDLLDTADIDSTGSATSGPTGGSIAIIPGVYYRPEEQFGFVMVLDASQKKGEPDAPTSALYYYRFPIEQVSWSTSSNANDNSFSIRLDETVFTERGFSLRVNGGVTTASGRPTRNPRIRASAEWTALQFPRTAFYPNIMGWFSYLPRGLMQCSHGVVSMDHAITRGQITIDSGEYGTPTNTDNDNDARSIDLTGSRGYIEKDWGTEFPSKYTWIQANDFRTNTSTDAIHPVKHGTSLLLSVATIPIPILPRILDNYQFEFLGFLSFFRYPHNGGCDSCFKILRFATYTGATVSYTHEIINEIPRRATHGEQCTLEENSETSDCSTHPNRKVVVILQDAQHILTVTAIGNRDGVNGDAATLYGPKPNNPSGGMHPYVREMLNVPVTVVLERRSDATVLFQGLALHGGFEIEGH